MSLRAERGNLLHSKRENEPLRRFASNYSRETRKCHAEPFGFTQAKLREASRSFILRVLPDRNEILRFLRSLRMTLARVCYIE